MTPQAKEILERIDEYLKYLDKDQGQSKQPYTENAVIIEDIRLKISELRNHASVDQVPPGASFRGIKRILNRILRPVARPQASYNHTAINTLEEMAALAEKMDTEHRYFYDALAELRKWLGDGISPRVEKIIGQVGKIEHDLKQYDPVGLMIEVRTMTEKLRIIEERINGLKSFADDTGKTLAETKGWVSNNLTPRLDALEKSGSIEKIDDLRERIDNLFKWVDETLTPTTMDLKEKINEVLIRTEVMPTSQILNSLASHQNLIEEHGWKISRLSDTIDPLEKNVRESVDQFGRELLIVLRDLESRFEETLDNVKAAPSPEKKQEISRQVIDVLEQVRYFYFELRARGGEDWLKDKFEQYVGTISTALKVEDNPEGRVVDLGCGNGIFLSLMNDAGYESIGVDTNTAMLASAKQRNVTVENRDALSFLREQETGQLDVITAMEFIEHLPRDVLVEFVAEVNRCLRPGGVLLLETLNAKTFAAYKWFYMDLTHQWLILPETLQVLLEVQGFEVLLTDYISPVADWERLKVAGDSKESANIDLLNEAVFGMQEYFCVARKPVR